MVLRAVGVETEMDFLRIKGGLRRGRGWTRVRRGIGIGYLFLLGVMLQTFSSNQEYFVKLLDISQRRYRF